MRGGIFTIFVAVLFLLPIQSWGGGISVDAGLTPAQGQFLVRSQLRYHIFRTQREGPITLDQFTLPVVAAYSLNPNITLMTRNGYRWGRRYKEGKVQEVTNRQFLNPMLMGKFKVYRLNTRKWIIGVSPTIAFMVPLNHPDKKLYEVATRTGLFGSIRRGSWAADLNITYRWPTYKVHHGRQMTGNFALAHHFIMNESATTTLSPVTELNYYHSLTQSTAQSQLLNGLGAKLTINSFVIEALMQWPLYGRSEIRPTSRWLLGTRFKF